MHKTKFCKRTKSNWVQTSHEKGWTFLMSVIKFLSIYSHLSAKCFCEASYQKAMCFACHSNTCISGASISIIGCYKNGKWSITVSILCSTRNKQYDGRVIWAHPSQCLHSPQLYLEPTDSFSSSTAEEPVLQTEPRNPTTGHNQTQQATNENININPRI